MTLLHELGDFPDLIEVTARELKIDPSLVEKDYWIMHALWGLQQQGYSFELKGGTSLSKGYRLIQRFSEDIDIQINPKGPLPTGRNHHKDIHAAARKNYFDSLAGEIAISGFSSVERDANFDDPSGQYRGAGIRLIYPPFNALPGGLKQGILLEAGFDQVAPNQPRDIASWAFEKAVASGMDEITDNRAVAVACYEPGYTLVEKLQTIATKYRRQQETGEMPSNFMRHYYDVYCLLGAEQVQRFIGTAAYHEHKKRRFPKSDDPDITTNEAFILSDASTRDRFEKAYLATAALYYAGQPPFEAVLDRIKQAARDL